MMLNIMLDTRTYQVEFAHGEVMKLSANVFADTMYTQCDADRNEYLHLDLLFNYQSLSR